MNKSIAIIGTLDTKGDQLEYLKKVIENRGQQVIMIDVGILGTVPFKPTISREKVARAGGTSLEEIISGSLDECGAINKMAEGASKVVLELYSRGELNGVLAVGGSMGTALALEVMSVLPIGIPKLILSTVAYSPAIPSDMLGGDIMMLPWFAGLWGLNNLSRQVLKTAAGAISGAVEEYDKRQVSTKKIVGVTSLGQTACRYVNRLKPLLEERGYEVAVFHVTGMSGRLFERAINDGLFVAALDLNAGVELLNEVTGGVGTAGKHRLEGAGKKGIPQIVSPGAIDAFFWGGDKPFPDRYRDRPNHRHNTLLNLVASSEEEAAAIGTLMAEKLNQATGPPAVVIPMKGQLPPRKAGKPGGVGGPGRPNLFFENLLNPGPKLEAFRDALMKDIRPEIRVDVMDAGLSEPQYVDTVLAIFDEMMKE